MSAGVVLVSLSRDTFIHLGPGASSMGRRVYTPHLIE